MPSTTYNFSEIERKWQRHWEEERTFKPLGRAIRVSAGQAEVLRPYRIPVSVRRRSPRRPPAQLHRPRRRRPQAAHGRIQRPVPDRLGRVRPADGELRDQDRPAPARRDDQERGQLPPAAQAHRLLLRLVARSGYDRPGVLQVDAVDLPEALRKGPRVQGGDPDQLVQLVQGRAGERGGRRRRVRALRRRGGPAHAQAVDAADHRLRRAAARRPGHGGLPREDQDAAAQLDRPLDRRGGGVPRRRGAAGLFDADLHDAAGHALRRDVHGPRAGAPARRQAAAALHERGGSPRLRRGRGAQVRLRTHRGRQGSHRRRNQGRPRPQPGQPVRSAASGSPTTS